MIRAALLPDRTIVRATGADVARLLDDLLTVEVETLAPGRARHAALLTPQGKIAYEGFVIKDRDGFLIDVATSAAEALAKRLDLYKLRADAAFAPTGDEFAVAVAWGDEADAPDDPPGLAYRDPRLSALGWRIVAPPHALTTWLEVGSAEGNVEGYVAQRIALGVPEGGVDFTSDDFPHDAMLDQLHGVDFDKGCFVGQEVVSRMKHRGTARRRILPVSIDGEAASGDDVTVGERSIGRLGSVSGAQGLAMLRIDRLPDDGTPIRAGDATLTVRKPDWATFDLTAA